MAIALQLRKSVLFLLWFFLFTVVVVIVTSNREFGFAQPPTHALAAQEAPGCPGERMGVQATGEYRSATTENGEYRDGSQVVHINGEPWGGADWAAGDRSYLALPPWRPDPRNVGGPGPYPEPGRKGSYPATGRDVLRHSLDGALARGIPRQSWPLVTGFRTAHRDVLDGGSGRRGLPGERHRDQLPR